jgi:hypothetical protein
VGPQGLVFGPLLLLVFINDIADGMTGLGRLFADDTKRYTCKLLTV